MSLQHSLFKAMFNSLESMISLLLMLQIYALI
jgi:hypothetical protein